ncbi:BRCA1-associated protein [Chlorella vulgaris]
MYTVRLQPAARQAASYAAVTAATATATASHSGSAHPSPSGTPRQDGTAAGVDEVDQIAFSAGNPRVEHLVGRVSLFRHLPPPGAVPASQQAAEHQARQFQEPRKPGPSKLGRDVDPGPSASSASPLAAAADGAVEAQHVDLPAGRNPQLCILALPADMGFAELCTFMGAYFQHVRDMRLVRREGRSSVCLVLLRFGAQQAADDFYRDFNGRPFCSLEPELLCRLVYVKEVECQPSAEEAGSRLGAEPLLAETSAAKQLSSSGVGGGGGAPAGTTELPTCPVCLERLDEHISGIVTTVCNHRFHNECLRRWGDTSCPVCRYCQHSNVTTSHCSTCNTSADLWICLICGHVGCGRYRGSHAAEHWQSSGHGYALELETQRVWDYVNDSYVHRLIQSKTDGKIVEVPSPAQHSRPGCSARPMSAGLAGTSDCGSEHCYGDPEMEEAMVLSKLDAMATEYNHLLVTQLESQRQYFEGLLVRQRAEAEAEAEAAGSEAAAAAVDAAAARAAAAESERRRRQADSKLADVTGRLQRAEEERLFLKQLNDTLLANQKEYQVRLKAAEEQLGQTTAAKDAAIRDLEEQVRDLMVFLEARHTIEAAGGAGSELDGGTLLPMPEAQQQRGAGARRARKR